MNKSFDLMIFDLDGTLVETAPEIFDAVNDCLQQFALPLVTLQQVTDWIGHGTRELLVQALAQSKGIDVSAVRASADLSVISSEFDQHYAKRCGTRSQLYPEVLSSLKTLRERGVKLAMVTNKEGRYTNAVLKVHGLMPLLDWVVCGDTLATKKPDPAGILECLKQFDVPRNRTLFVGDSSIDVATARNADIQVWVLPYGYNMGQPISTSNPDRVIADCSYLLDPKLS